MDRLTVIFADMAKTALSWEKEHGTPQHDNRNIKLQKSLTVIGVINKLNTSGNVVEGGNDDHQG